MTTVENMVVTITVMLGFSSKSAVERGTQTSRGKEFVQR